MSGVASIGSRVKLQMPTPIKPRVSTSIIQRCRIENRTIRSSRPGWWAAALVVIRCALLADVRLDQVALRDDDLLAFTQTREDLHLRGIAGAGFDVSGQVGLALTYEYGFPAVHRLQRGQRHHQVHRFLCDRDPRLDCCA